MSVTEEMHDRRGHEIKGQAVEQRMRGIHVGEAGREESPSDERRVGGKKGGQGWIHVHATRGDVAHVDAKVVEHEPQQGAVAGRALCGDWSV